MLELILLAYLSYRNGMMARRKEQNPIAWGFYTVLAYFGGIMIGAWVVFSFFSKEITLSQLATMKPDVQMQQLQLMFENHPLDYLTIFVFGFGGYLFIRYLLERRPDKGSPKVNNAVDNN